MNRLKTATALLALGLVVAPLSSNHAAGSETKTEAEAAIFERQMVMTQLESDAALLGKIVAGMESASKLPAVTRAIAEGAKDAVRSYADKVPGGRTKPEAWEKYDDFMQRMEAFAKNTELMAAQGEKGDVVGVTGLMIDALPCKQCHDVYRTPKKPG